MTRPRLSRGLCMLALLCSAILAGTVSGALGLCPPFTDVSDPAFCSLVQEIFYLGITTGTTATTFDPAGNVTRLQMAAFLSRTVDRTLVRGNRRAALQRFWTPSNGARLSVTTLGGTPLFAASDGSDLWVSGAGGTVQRVRGGDGKLLETWTGATIAGGVVFALGRVFVAGGTDPGSLYRIDPTQAAGAVTTVASNLGGSAVGIAFDGSNFWTTNLAGASVSIVSPAASIPWPVSTITGAFSLPFGVLYDGANVWIADDGRLSRMSTSGFFLQTVTLGGQPEFMVFDGENIWVPNDGNYVSVVRASNGAILATLTGNGLNAPYAAAFDGERVLVTNHGASSVSLWKAANLAALGPADFFSGNPKGACSDGVSFWIALQGSNVLARF